MPDAHPDKLICVCYCSAWKFSILTGSSIENTKNYFFNQLLGCPKTDFDLEWYAEKRLYAQYDSMHPNLATDPRNYFKLCSFSITTITYHTSKTIYIYENC